MSENELSRLENRVNNLKEQKIRTEEQLKNLREQKNQIISELSVLGITPKDLSASIVALETKIRTQLADIDAQIPEDIT